MNRHPLELVVAAKARLVELEQEAAKLRDLISFYEDGPASHHTRVASTRAQGSGGRRALSRTWAAVLEILSEHGERGASYDQIIDAAARRGLNVSRNVLRSQMGNFAKRDLVESPSKGVWRVSSASRGDPAQPPRAESNTNDIGAGNADESRGEVGALFAS